MDASDALRLVVFEYLLPDLRRSKLRKSLLSFRSKHDDLLLLSPTEVLVRLADEVLAPYAYPSSYHRPRVKRPPRSLCLHALLLADGRPRFSETSSQPLQDNYVFS
jgi:hypothetical protein